MTQASYVGAVYDWDTDAVMVWERGEGGRKVVAHHAPHYFYVPDEEGEYTSIYGDKLKKLVFDNKDEFQQHARNYSRKFESDIPPLFKVLMNEYYARPVPDVHYAFLDIEVDYKSSLGFSSPENPYAPINAVTIYQSWTKKYLTYAVPPKGWRVLKDDFHAKIKALWAEHKLGFEPNVVLCVDEAELIREMVNDIQDADIISGWNSEFFDLPYIMKRIERVNPKLANKMSFIGCKPPKESTVERYGSPSIVYKLNGRTHLDYLDLFKKFTFEGRTSYSLANIAAEELDIPKLEYDGTLEQLYNRDFAHFVAYNARDVEVLVKLDDKFKFIALVNQMAHENTCLFENMKGTVRYVETGITNRAHNVHNLIVADKRIMTDGEKVEGALVLSPLVGLHDWLGSVDINSLYPSVIRALNISPEKFIGQFANGEEDWRGILDMDDEMHTMVNDHHESVTMTGAEWWKAMIDNKWVITAFGTVFDEGNGLGIVPEAIEFWYAERKRLQAEKKKWQKVVKELQAQLKEKPEDAELTSQLVEANKQVDHYDLLQLTKKIQLNSTYGALLSPHFRLGRKEMGASVTACGRQITTFMIEQIGELVTGKKCTVSKSMHVDKDGSVSNIYHTDSDVILLSDTDSCYFKTNATNKEDAIQIADAVAEAVNDMFPGFMRKTFNCQPKHDDLIKAGREIVGSKGLFLNAKKKYTIKVVNLDGFDLNPPKLKTVGSEMKKADTPKVIQDFLKHLMDIILDGGSYEDVEKYINTQRSVLVRAVKDPIQLGAAKQINNLDAKYAEWQRVEKPGKGRVNLPGHVRAAINYNELAQEFEPGVAKLLRAGDKGIVFYLQPNERALKSIAFPADTSRFPQWFLDNFKMDKKKTEDKMIDAKLERIFEALDWEIPTPQKSMVKSILKF
jgi:DNA polymerase elongation subunit (family B)